MYRIFRAALPLRGLIQAIGSPLRLMQTPVRQPSRFFAQLPSPSSAEVALALRSAIKSRRSVELERSINEFRAGCVGKVQITDAEYRAIDLVMERMRCKYGLRQLSVQDDWETIAVVTGPEEWVCSEIKKGKEFEDTIISTIKQLVPKASCQSIEDVMHMISMDVPALSEINYFTEEGNIKPK